MKVEQMREFIGEKYPSQSWKSRVARMAPNQVIAIFHSIKNREEKLARVRPDTDEYKQLDIFDVFGYKILRMNH